MDTFIDICVRIVVSVIMGLILSYPAMLLWNSCFVPAVTFAREIGWLQAFGIAVMFGLFMAKTDPAEGRRTH